jgi:hypothetical protein
MRTRTIQAARPNGLQFDNDQPVPAELAERLYRAGESQVGDLVSGFSATQRANLAVYCYHKAHLHRVGLAIAATCDRSVLELTWGRALGKALFEQSRDPALAQIRTGNPYRPAVTLATLQAMQTDPDDSQDDSQDWIGGDEELPSTTVTH